MWFMIGAGLVGVAVIVAIAVNSINSNNNENRAMLARNQQRILDRLDQTDSLVKQLTKKVDDMDEWEVEVKDGDKLELIAEAFLHLTKLLEEVKDGYTKIHTMAMQNIAVSVAHARLAGYAISDCEDFPHRVEMNGKPVNVYEIYSDKEAGN
ncbi:MAG TPA: hypothetical protein DIT59_00605 [Leclercia sp.]|nr:hypothetical protein [Leclercia sp.]